MRRRIRRGALERIGDRSLLVLPQVFNPVVFRSGKHFSRFIREAPELDAIAPGTTALDLGTGSGIQAVFAAHRGYRVTAVDINPHAVRCARINALVNNVEDRVDVLEGDLFGPLGGRTFDLVLFNPPYFKGDPTDDLDRAWRSPDVVERFAAALPRHLNPDGIAAVVWSSHADHLPLLEAAQRAGLSTSRARDIRLFGERLFIFLIRHAAACE